MLHLRSIAALVASVAVVSMAPVPTIAQNTSTSVPPVIDVHAHAMDDASWAAPMCPNTSKFTASDTRAQEGPIGWVQEECTPKLYPAAKGQYIGKQYKITCK